MGRFPNPQSPQKLYSVSTNARSVVILIDDIEIPIDDFSNYELYLDPETSAITGSVVINDNLDLSNTLKMNPYENKNIIKIYINDFFDEYFYREFVIVNVKEAKSKGQFKVLKFNFIDILTYEMKNTYVSKSFSDIKLSDIFMMYYNNFEWNKIIDKETLELKIDDTVISHKHIVVPQHISFFDFFRKSCVAEGYIFFQTKKEIILTKKENISPANAEENKIDGELIQYRQAHFDNNYPFKIHDYNLVYNNSLNTTFKNPANEYNYFNRYSKKIETHKNNLKQISGDLFLYDTTITDDKAAQSTNGYRLDTQVFPQGDYSKFNMMDAYSENTVLDIVVPGNNKYSRLFQIVDVTLAGSMNHMKGRIEGDVFLSGKYICVKISDLLIANKMSQRLTLVRADFQKDV